MRHLRNFGLIAFISGLTLFVVALSMNEYQLTDDSFSKAFPEEDKYETFKPVVVSMMEHVYDSKIDFIKDYQAGIQSINAGFQANMDWDNVLWDDRSFQVVKYSSVGLLSTSNLTWFYWSFFLMIVGSLIYIIPNYFTEYPGIKNNYLFFYGTTNRGVLGIATGIGLILFYIFLYQFPEYITNWTLMLDPLSHWLNGSPADQWFLYGFLYCLAMTVMGIRMAIKYRNNNYQLVRTVSVVFFQLCFAFTLPQILKRLNMPAYDLKSAWPLEYTFFFDYRLDEHLASGTIGIWMLVWGIVLFAIGVPLFTYLYGKRWYCSWVCGCGGLAETLGDPYRQLSDKSLKAWKIERYMVHGVLVFAIFMTAAVLYSYFSGNYEFLGMSTYEIRSQYGFFIGFAFAGVVGTGFYPLMGNRMWCRFGCPLAAYLGIIQRFKSRFRITTNGGQCISCGNCSTYCEMGIDVRWYAQRGQNVVRSSCVGCGVCSAVCPRGVLKLENGPVEGRIDDDPIFIGKSSVSLNV